MNKVWTLLPALLACTAAPAYAQNAGFTGRIEARAGYDEMRGAITIFNELYTANYGEGDLGYGVEGGVDYQIFEGLTAGAYAGIDFSEADGCQTRVIFEDPDDSACIDMGNSFNAGIRVGFPTGGGGLLYGKIGVSTAKFSASYFDGEDDYFEGKDSVAGIHVGAGIEVDVGRSVYAKGEYLYHTYNNAFTEELASPNRFNPHRHQLMFGVGFRIGGPRVVPAAAVVAAPPPPPPPAAATQTCANGTVILATDVCPAPPAPAPAPAPATSGERG